MRRVTDKLHPPSHAWVILTSPRIRIHLISQQAQIPTALVLDFDIIGNRRNLIITGGLGII